MCSALLSWRSPPRSSRCRSRCPDEQGIGAVPVRRAKLASLAKRSAPAVRLDQCEQLALERVHLAAQQAQLGDLLARHSHAGGGG
jgi:hypothetical protein